MARLPQQKVMLRMHTEPVESGGATRCETLGKVITSLSLGFLKGKVEVLAPRIDPYLARDPFLTADLDRGRG